MAEVIRIQVLEEKPIRKPDLNATQKFIAESRMYARYLLGKTPNNHKKLKPEVVQEDMIKIIFHAIAEETK